MKEFLYKMFNGRIDFQWCHLITHAHMSSLSKPEYCTTLLHGLFVQDFVTPIKSFKSKFS